MATGPDFDYRISHWLTVHSRTFLLPAHCQSAEERVHPEQWTAPALALISALENSRFSSAEKLPIMSHQTQS